MGCHPHCLLPRAPNRMNFTEVRMRFHPGISLPRLVPCFAIVALTAGVATRTPAPKKMTCPPGYHAYEEDDARCIANKHPEPMWEVELRQREWMSPRSAPF